MPSSGGADLGLSSPQHPTRAVPCCCTQRNKIITEFLAPYFAASTSFLLPCKSDGQSPVGQRPLMDTSSETSSPRTSCLAPRFSAIKTDNILLYHSLHTGSFLTAPELFPTTDPQ